MTQQKAASSTDAEGVETSARAVSGGRTVFNAKGTPAQLGEKVSRLVMRLVDSLDHILVVTFSRPLRLSERRDVIERLHGPLLTRSQQIFEDECGDDYRYAGADWWGAPRFTVAEKLGPSLVIPWDEPSWVFAAWSSRNVLVLGRVNDYRFQSVAGVTCGHWHPDSRTSGVFSNAFYALGEGLGLDAELRDEDGWYFSLGKYRDDSAELLARRLEEAVRGWELFGAEDRILQAHFLGCDRALVDMLGAYDNSGYEIEDFNLRAAPDVLAVLEKRNPAPSQSEAVAWLSAAETALRELRPHSYQNGDDHPLLEALRELAAAAE